MYEITKLNATIIMSKDIYDIRSNPFQEIPKLSNYNITNLLEILDIQGYKINEKKSKQTIKRGDEEYIFPITQTKDEGDEIKELKLFDDLGLEMILTDFYDGQKPERIGAHTKDTAGIKCELKLNEVMASRDKYQHVISSVTFALRDFYKLI